MAVAIDVGGRLGDIRIASDQSQRGTYWIFGKQYLSVSRPQNAIHEVVRGALADYEQLFRAQEVNKRMKDKAAHACHALFRARLAEEMRLRKGTPTAEHVKLVLSIIDGPRFP